MFFYVVVVSLTKKVAGQNFRSIVPTRLRTTIMCPVRTAKSTFYQVVRDFEITKMNFKRIN